MRAKTSPPAAEAPGSALRRAGMIGGAAAALAVAAVGVAWVGRSGEVPPHAGIPTPGDSKERSVSGLPPSIGEMPARAAISDAILQDASLSVPANAPVTAVEAPLDEPALMTRLRSVKDADPAAAVALAREGNRRFPDGPDAAERTSILIHALAAQGLASEARGEAEDMVERYPDSSWVREVELFTGAHRHRNIRLNEKGTLEYY